MTETQTLIIITTTIIIIILIKRYSLTRVKLTALYKHLIRKNYINIHFSKQNLNYCSLNYRYRQDIRIVVIKKRKKKKRPRHHVVFIYPDVPMTLWTRTVSCGNFVCAFHSVNKKHWQSFRPDSHNNPIGLVIRDRGNKDKGHTNQPSGDSPPLKQDVSFFTESG